MPKIELVGRASSPAPPKPKSSGRLGWTVQAGSFALQQNAAGLRDKLRTQRFDASVERIMVNGRVLYRVRVGPQGSRPQSEQVQARLRREMGINGRVMPLD